MTAAAGTTDAATADVVVQPVTPVTATALQYQWTQLMPEPSDAELKKRIAGAPRPAAVPSMLSVFQRGARFDSDDDSDAEEDRSIEDTEEATPAPWQSARDLPERRVMVQRILALTERRNPAGPGRRRDRNGVPIESPGRDHAAALAKRIELSLYSRAGSLDEYKNNATLRRRLQSLVSLSFHEAAAAKDTSMPPLVRCQRLGKRSSTSSPYAGSAIIKRRRLTLLQSATRSHSSHSSRILGPLGEDCVRAVFSFLDGRETMRLRVLNQFAAEFLPSCVLSLEVEVSKFQGCFVKGSSASTLLKLTSLERLVVFRQSNPCAEPTSTEQTLALHAWGCAELDVTHDNVGEGVVRHLASAMQAGACSRLKQLQLVSVFTNTSKRNGLQSLCQALRMGCCPDLEDLLLGGNSITDMGATEISRLLRSRALPRLERLDLRRNYIGETGLQRLVAALTSSSRRPIKYLCMGGNLITDKCVAPLKEMLARGVCPQMRFLGLEDNFLSPDGVQTIIQAAVSGGMVPKLHRVSSDGAAAELAA
ncbi:hypothetical protein P43SY_009433 [Pythium insidiosum]|uniref:Uncharacterized protein n=1 Tax=Pythium insidiosum TaxID=114742 RepID=A0AAD5MDL8_PYTIN|nr:hypothetical protein P43SY_009433 [Pythium insidiosum]